MFYRRNADANLRNLERKALQGDYSDKIAYARALVRLGRSEKEQTALDAALLNDFGPADQLSGSSENPKSYVVIQEAGEYDIALIIGLIEQEGEIDSIGGPTRIYVDDRTSDSRQNLLGALYDEYQVNESIGMAKEENFPQGFTKFVTPFGDFITAGVHVIPFENLVSFLEESHQSNLIANQRRAERIVDAYTREGIHRIANLPMVLLELSSIFQRIDSVTSSGPYGGNRAMLLEQAMRTAPEDVKALYYFAIQLGYGIEKAAELANLIENTPFELRVGEVMRFMDRFRHG